MREEAMTRDYLNALQSATQRTVRAAIKNTCL